MESLSASPASALNTAQPGSLGSASALMMLRKAMDIEADSATQLIEALPQPALASSGSLGTLLNTYA